MNSIFKKSSFLATIIICLSNVQAETNCSEFNKLKKQFDLDTSEKVRARMLILFFGYECSIEQVETKQWFNEILFFLIQDSPEILIRELEKEPNYVQDRVISEVESPVNDLIDISQCLIVLEKLELESLVKKKIIKSIEVALLQISD